MASSSWGGTGSVGTPADGMHQLMDARVRMLEAENEKLRKALSAHLQELEHIKMRRLDWSMLCDHECPVCTALDDAIRGDTRIAERALRPEPQSDNP
jgi:hypothetical protein